MAVILSRVRQFWVGTGFLNECNTLLMSCMWLAHCLQSAGRSSPSHTAFMAISGPLVGCPTRGGAARHLYCCYGKTKTGSVLRPSIRFSAGSARMPFGTKNRERDSTVPWTWRERASAVLGSAAVVLWVCSMFASCFVSVQVWSWFAL